MRLIDADHLEERHCEDCNGNGNKICTKGDHLCGTMQWVDEEQTIDPIKHGHWIIHPSGQFGSCSVCFQQVDFPEFKGELGRYNKVFQYCPNCGSKQDEVVG